MTGIETLSFEEAMRELEATVGKLEHGEATLEESIALYERGAALRAPLAAPGSHPGWSGPWRRCGLGSAATNRGSR